MSLKNSFCKSWRSLWGNHSTLLCSFELRLNSTRALGSSQVTALQILKNIDELNRQPWVTVGLSLTFWTCWQRCLVVKSEFQALKLRLHKAALDMDSDRRIIFVQWTRKLQAQKRPHNKCYCWGALENLLRVLSEESEFLIVFDRFRLFSQLFW